MTGSHESIWRVLLLVLLLASGCSSQVFVPVVDIGAGTTSGARYHRVSKGDTLYSIAFRYGYDYRELAAANNIKPPYTIFVDQKIALARDRGRGQRSSKPAVPVSKPTMPSRPLTPEPSPSDGGLAWAWPLSGEVIKPFSLSGDLNKGIDIAGRMGNPVSAAADGVVVYGGGNLRGYGKLVIIKHNDKYLSAYGNNQAVLVREGDQVRRGQTVARVGSNAGKVEMLHFEIRLNGKPIDPLGILPPP